MSETFLCDDKDSIVAYLYDELDDTARRRTEDHLRVCGVCASEVAGLRAAREELAAWAPPETRLEFAITSADRLAPQADVVRPTGWWSSKAVPAWARAAAAVLVVTTGLGLANLQIRYDANGLVVTTGWMSPAPPGPHVAARAADDWRPALAALESSLRKDIEAGRQIAAVPAAAEGGRSGDLTAQRMAELIDQSERRQRRELALRLTQFSRDLEVQRRSDLVRINQGLGQFEGRAGAEIQRQRQMLDLIMRVSTQPPPQ
ncbi:MAG: hypothetical protein OEW19_02715 [Acidobacteriota bacterium]|nr:hypothetical protein [Acidobacteriota bacterium]